MILSDNVIDLFTVTSTESDIPKLSDNCILKNCGDESKNTTTLSSIVIESLNVIV